jgi:hypothetical protein
MNFFHKFWEQCKNKERPFTTHFFDNSFYSQDFLAEKRRELGDLFPQEYPETDLSAFISSGRPFFDKAALAHYLTCIRPAERELGGYYDLAI